MAYKVIKGKNKIRGEQTFVDNITGSIISASAYYGTNYTGATVSASIGLFTYLTASVISASTIIGIQNTQTTGNLLLTASVSNATITFTKGDSSTFPITVNNVASSSFAANAATASNLSGFNQNNYVLTSSFNNFTASYNTGSFTGSFTGSLFGTASFAINATTASYYNTSSLLITASVSNATVTFTKGNGSTFPIIINNVTNAETASLLTGFNKNDYVTTSSFNNFTASYNTGSFSGSFIGTASYAITASYALNAQTASFYDTSSLLITASVSNATITFTKGNNTTFPLTINNVVSAQTASYVLNATSASYASNSDLLDNRDSTTFAGTGSNTFNGNQIVTGTITSTSTITGSTGLFTSVTSSFTGSAAGLYNLTASGISNFTNDVRGQFSQGTNITIVGGVISSTTSGSSTFGQITASFSRSVHSVTSFVSDVGVSLSSNIITTIALSSSRDLDEMELAPVVVAAGGITAGVGFNVIAVSLDGDADGTYLINYIRN
jgi:hypothetical protein